MAILSGVSGMAMIGNYFVLMAIVQFKLQIMISTMSIVLAVQLLLLV
jgi:hypothetical protein